MSRCKDKDKGETGQPPNYSSAPRLRLAALVGAMVPVVVLAANIVGTPEPDVLEGTPQADTINGKGGADTMMGLPGDDTYFVAQPDDEVLEAVGDGTDTIRSTISFQLPINVENLTLVGGAAIDGTGNGLDNRLTGNSASNVLSGRAGADRMFGLAGNDTYIVDEAGDVVNEAEDDGLDMVRSSVTHTLRNHVEDLILTGVATASGIGNALANSITGNSANNILNGLAGDDSLRGGGGDDRLIGGPGNDRLIGSGGRNAFQFDAPLDALTNADRILDFDPAKDVMRLIGEVFPALTTAGALPVAAFRAGVAANDASDRILYDPATGIVRYDADGTGPTASVRFATLVSAPALTNANFVVVDPVVTAVNFTNQIQPIFSQRCDHCHSGSSAPQGLQLDAANSYAESRQRGQQRGTEPEARRAGRSGQQLPRAESGRHRRRRRPHAARRRQASPTPKSTSSGNGSAKGRTMRKSPISLVLLSPGHRRRLRQAGMRWGPIHAEDLRCISVVPGSAVGDCPGCSDWRQDGDNGFDEREGQAARVDRRGRNEGRRVQAPARLPDQEARRPGALLQAGLDRRHPLQDRELLQRSADARVPACARGPEA